MSDADIIALASRPLAAGPLTLRNRLIRSATYEGLGAPDGTPQCEALGGLYRDLAEGGAGALITGFVYVSPEGRAMQPGQCGLDDDAKVDAWAATCAISRCRQLHVPLIMQLAHAGRQTLRGRIGQTPVGASRRRCAYFRQPVRALRDAEVDALATAFGEAARRARKAGFDGVQIHAAHGYLVHQFLSPWTNRRSDRWGEPNRFLLAIIEAVRARCGDDVAVWVKLSGTEDRTPGITIPDTVRTSQRLEAAGVGLIEISCGTMEYALNIMRGAWPLDTILAVNPRFSRIPRLLQGLWKALAAPVYLRHLIPFTPAYNLQAAAAVAREVSVPVATVGGIRSLADIGRCLSASVVDAVSLCRPLVREPDLPARMLSGAATASACTNCNLCTIYCDSDEPTRCRCVRAAAGSRRP